MWSFNLISYVVSNVPYDVVPHSSHVSSKCDPWFYPNDTLWPNVLYVVPTVLTCPWILFHLLCQMFLVPLVHMHPANMFLTLSKCFATCSQCSIMSFMLFPQSFIIEHRIREKQKKEQIFKELDQIQTCARFESSSNVQWDGAFHKELLTKW